MHKYPGLCGWPLVQAFFPVTDVVTIYCGVHPSYMEMVGVTGSSAQTERCSLQLGETLQDYLQVNIYCHSIDPALSETCTSRDYFFFSFFFSLDFTELYTSGVSDSHAVLMCLIALQLMHVNRKHFGLASFLD